MLIIRRRRPSGPPRRIILGGPNLNVDAPCPGEAEATLQSNVGGRAEGRVSAIIDALSRVENTARVSYDRTGPYEFISATGLDYRGILESQTGISVLTDARANIEFCAIAQADWRAIGENLARIIVDSATPVFEDIISTRVDATGSAEFLHTWVLDVFARQENVGLAVALSDSSGYLESLERTAGDSVGALESTSRLVADRLAQAESSGTTSTVFDTVGQIELLAVARRDSVGAVEQSATARADASAASEVITTARVTFDSRAFLENLAVWSREGLVPDESLRGVTSLAAAVLEVLLTARSDGITPIAVVGSSVVRADIGGPIEFLGGQRVDTGATFESQGSAFSSDSNTILESLRAAALNAASPAEAIASILIEDFPEYIEFMSLTTFSADSFGNIENAGHSIVFPDLLLGVMEIAGGVGVDTQAPAEATAIIAFPFDPGAHLPIEAGWLALDKTRTSISTGRVRLIIAPYTAPEVWAQPFDPLAVGSLDTFGFDFTADAGGATIVSTSWTATFDPGSSSAVDDTPSARCITSWAPTTIYMINPLDDTLETINGVFSTAVIGTFPASAVGGTYNIYVQVNFSDTRSVLVTTKMLCVAAES